MPYRIAYSHEAEDHIRELTARDAAIILDAVDKQLTHQAESPARNRKPMRANPLAAWELRVSDLRVYYEIESGDVPTVHIRAIGVKKRNRIYIGGNEVEL